MSSNLTTQLITINKGVLVNDTNFTIEINIINHFLNNRAQIGADLDMMIWCGKILKEIF